MSNSERGFSISGDAYRPKDIRITADRLRRMGFESDDDLLFTKGDMDYNLTTGDILYGGREIVNNCRNAETLASFYYNIVGGHLEW